MERVHKRERPHKDRGNRGENKMKDVGEYFTLIPNKFIWDCGGENSY